MYPSLSRGTYNVWYSVFRHVGGGVPLIMVGEGVTYNVWYSVSQHVGVVVPLIMVGEGRTYNVW